VTALLHFNYGPILLLMTNTCTKLTHNNTD